jgi:glycosyltransferase involved in cell wall biosynthesis
MKVLYDYTAFIMQARGGVSRIMCEIIKRELTRADVDGRVFAGFHKNFEMRELSRQFPGKVKGMLLPQAVAKQRLTRPINRALFIPFAKRFDPDICHYTFTLVPPVPRRTKTIITVHDLIGEIYSPAGTDPQVKEREIALRRADGIICISENTKQDLLKYYDVKDKPVIVAYHGNSMRIQPGRAPDVGMPYLLYVGVRGSGYKNSSMVIDAFARSGVLKDHALVFFGGAEFSSEELKMMKGLGISGRVFHRRGGDRDLAAYYKNATALVYPSRYEGFGLPPIEAMGLECPVLASSSAPMPEIIGDAALFFNPNSPEGLLGAFDKLLLEKGTRQALIERGREREKLFSWEKTSDKIHQFYKDVLGE